MSFFVSKSLESLVDESILRDDSSEEIFYNESDLLFPLSLKIDETLFEVESIKGKEIFVHLDNSTYIDLIFCMSIQGLAHTFIFNKIERSVDIADLEIHSYEKLTSNLIKVCIFIKN